MDNNDIIWLAGLFEGEGCISFTSGSSNGVQLIVGMTDEDVIRKVHAITDSGTVKKRTKKNNRKDVFVWTVYSKLEIEKILNCIYPWMGLRRSKKIEEALERLKLNKGSNRPIEHGSRNGYRMEQRRGIDNCSPCREAHLQYFRDRRKNLNQ